MKKEAMNILEQLALEDTGKALSTLAPQQGTGEAASAIIWPLGSRFKGKVKQILKCGYQPEFEPQADDALEALALNNDDWSQCPIEVLAVLYERFTQFCTLMIAHDKTNATAFIPPAQLSADAKLKFLAIFWLYGMTLPYPVNGKALFEPGKLFPNLSNTRH